ncbi:MAG: LamG domain-containing protein, partial [Archangium sp.]|nr:LamG domain-containing protein [Archangium sp.]
MRRLVPWVVIAGCTVPIDLAQSTFTCARTSECGEGFACTEGECRQRGEDDLTTSCETENGHQRCRLTWHFTQPWNYDFSPGIELDGQASLALVDQLDDDNAETGFGGGTRAGTAWDEAAKGLRLGPTQRCDGTVTSCAGGAPSGLPQSSKLIGLWPFDSDLSDKVGRGVATVQGSVPIGADAKVGSGALQLDGTSNLNIALSVDGGIDFDTPLTLSLWLKPDPTWNAPGLPHSLPAIIACDTGYAFNFWLMNPTNGTPNQVRVARYNGGASGPQIASRVALSSPQYFHLAAVKRGDTFELYVDGFLQGTSADVTPAPARCPTLQLGNGFRGAIDQVSLWNTALTADEVAQLHQRQAMRFSGELVSRVISVGDDLPLSPEWST